MQDERRSGAAREASLSVGSGTPFPIIDLASIVGDGRSPVVTDPGGGAALASREAALADLAHACRTTGVFYVSHHGVPDAVLTGTAARFDAFFDLPEEERRAIAVQDGETCGYEPLDRRAGEFNDSFHCVDGLEHFGDLAGLPLPNANKWPVRPAGLEASVGDYMRAMHGLGGRVLAALALSLSLDPLYFAPMLGPLHGGSLRARRYPPGRLAPGRPGAAAHTDGPPLALIVQNDVVGLESHVPGQGFVVLPNVAGTVLCQLGSVFSRWTNDRYVPNLHRIVNHDPSGERRSLIYWLPILPDATIACVPTCRDSSAADDRYPAISFRDYLVEWIRGLP